MCGSDSHYESVSYGNVVSYLRGYGKKERIMRVHEEGYGTCGMLV